MPSPRTASAFHDSMRGPYSSPSPESPDTHTNWSIRKASTKPNPKDLPVASPSASILLISPQNRILLLHRVAESTSFASAHVFPGGHVDEKDGELPPNEDPRCHEDGPAYRIAAIRECFEESGLLLAYRKGSSRAEMLEMSEQERVEGRKEIHRGAMPFRQWVEQRGGVPDVEGLIPFTRWLTPANIPKRFSTQMYLYFLPLESSLVANGSANGPAAPERQIHIPTPDGGVEHTAAQFLYPQEWLDLSLSKEIVLFPPQFFLLSLVADFLFPPPKAGGLNRETLQHQRDALMDFVRSDGDPPWGEKCISPDPVKLEKGFMIMGMGEPGPELEGTGRKGDVERVLKVELDRVVERGRQRPRPRKVIWRREWEGEEGAKL